MAADSTKADVSRYRSGGEERIRKESLVAGKETDHHEDRWVPTMCGGCYGGSCPQMVHVVDGVVVKIEGYPGVPQFNGRLCARGMAEGSRPYDPYRLKSPMKRTNPKKGFDQDPGWVEITWEEAIDTLVEKLARVREKSPHGLYVGTMDETAMVVSSLFQAAYGVPPMTVRFSGAGIMCGEAIHQIGGEMYSSNSDLPDLRLAKYAIIVGGSLGEGWSATTQGIQFMMERRQKAGLKVVVIDPQQTLAAAKADEWIPIRPTTDLALFLGMMNVLVHELGVYDREFLKRQTNAPYLIGVDGYYLRDRETNKPLVWDSKDNRAKTFDDPTIKDFALEGSYRVENAVRTKRVGAADNSDQVSEGKPGFQLFKDYIKQYTPEWASEKTTIPAETIRRITKELGEAAQIGSTIILDGKEYAYRPASVTGYRGINNHTNAPQTEFARVILNQLLGSSRAPGGVASLDMRANNNTLPVPIPADKDGITRGEFTPMETPWKFPFEDASLAALTARHVFGTGMAILATIDPEKYGIADSALPQVLIHCRANPVMNGGNPKVVGEALSKIPFYVDFTLFLDESDQFADMVLPDCHYLERYAYNNLTIFFSGILIQQPVIKPMYQARPFPEIMWEVAKKLKLVTGPMGILNMENHGAKLRQLVPGSSDVPIFDNNKEYSYKEHMDVYLQKVTGHDLVWFEEHGHNLTLTPPERFYYPWGWNQSRIPFYYEGLKRRGAEIREHMEKDRVKEKTILDPDLWCSQYDPIPTWYPSVVEKADQKYDLYASSRRTSITRGTTSPTTIAWLMEIAETDPYHLKVKINTETARSKGIKDGDLVWVESEVGRVKAKAKVTECVHHELVGFSSNLGRRIKHEIAEGKGAHFNSLLPWTHEHHSPVALALEGTARVRIYKAEED